MIRILALILSLCVIVPNSAFVYSLALGLRWTDFFYPWKQHHAAFESHSSLIRLHVLCSSLALLIGQACLWPIVPFDEGLVAYVVLVSTGNVAAAIFSHLNKAHSAVVTFSFWWLGLASALPAWSCFVERFLLLRNQSAAKDRLATSLVCLFGAAVCFRGFALLMPHLLRIAGSALPNKEATAALVWASWSIPLLIFSALK